MTLAVLLGIFGLSGAEFARALASAADGLI
jgi:hypothetical protein